MAKRQWYSTGIAGMVPRKRTSKQHRRTEHYQRKRNDVSFFETPVKVTRGTTVHSGRFLSSITPLRGR